MSAAPRKDRRSLHLVPLSQLAERSVSWLWRGWIPMGHLTILDGDPGMGKTLLTLDMCARVTTGKAFPGDIPTLGPVNVILINAEDDMEDTIKPRLRGMGADLDRVFDIRDVKSGLAGPLHFPTDRRLLDHFLTENQARLVVIDPIMSFLDRRIQSSNDQHVRRALGSLTWLARKHRCAILLVRHLNKARGGRALYRGGASIGFTASCRSVLLAGPDPQQPGGRVLAQVKQNLAAAQPSLLYTATTEQSETPLIAWRGASTLSADDLVAIVWTSGTTGMPKGAVFDHRNLQAVAVGAGAMGAQYDVRLAPLPFAHVAFMSRPWEEIENVITTVITPTPWTAGDTLRLMVRERVTVGQGVPTQWRLVLDHPDFASSDLSSLRIAGTGAATVPPELVREMEHRLACPVVIGYTSTEAAISTGTVPGDTPEVISQTVGRPRVNVELEVIDDDAQVCPTGVVGRVRCRSGAVMRGYWQDPARTAEVLDADGWLTTGDLGFLDARGYLTLVGRRSEMYIRGGYNVYPGEVERVLSQHPEVAQVAVLGVPDPVLGEIGVAFVVPAGTPDGRASPALAALRTFCRNVIADYKAPDRLVVVDALPMTSVGKVDKRALAEDAARASDG